MYDIFDDLFEDDFALESYDDSSDIDTELAFEAAMSLDTEYDPAYEGFGDVMGRIGDAVKSGARNLIRKVKEAFTKLGQWIKDRFAGMRAGAAKGESKTLQRVLKSLDNRVKNASGEDKRRVKEKVDKIKRGIMRAIDASRNNVEQINKQLTNGVVIFEAMQKIGEQFIKKMRSRITEGNNTDNTADGNDLIDKSNAMVRKFEELDRAVQTAADKLASALNESRQMAENKASDINSIIKEIVKDKYDFTAIQNAARVAVRITDEGRTAATELERRLNDKRGKIVRNTNAFMYDPDTQQMHAPGTVAYMSQEDIKKKDLKLDETSKISGSVLAHNWYTYVMDVKKCSTALNQMASTLGKTRGVTQASNTMTDTDYKKHDLLVPDYDNI